MSELVLIPGSTFVDARGAFWSTDLPAWVPPIKRAYLVSNHQRGRVRAWHAHRNEAKVFSCARGSVLVAAVKVDAWDRPDKSIQPRAFTLSWMQSASLFVPPGFANGWMSLSDDAQLMVLSTSTMEESLADDVRFPARYWDCWEVLDR